MDYFLRRNSSKTSIKIEDTAEQPQNSQWNVVSVWTTESDDEHIHRKPAMNTKSKPPKSPSIKVFQEIIAKCL